MPKCLEQYRAAAFEFANAAAWGPAAPAVAGAAAP